MRFPNSIDAIDPLPRLAVSDSDWFAEPTYYGNCKIEPIIVWQSQPMSGVRFYGQWSDRREKAARHRANVDVDWSRMSESAQDRELREAFSGAGVLEPLPEKQPPSFKVSQPLTAELARELARTLALTMKRGY